MPGSGYCELWPEKENATFGGAVVLPVSVLALAFDLQQLPQLLHAATGDGHAVRQAEEQAASSVKDRPLKPSV